MKKTILFKVSGVCLLLLSFMASALEYHSSAQPSIMVELYTSEGCNSCPPAEHYLNKLQHHPALWKTLFPIAFHVDYWNYLGWEDRFSDPSYAQRQRQYARYLGKNTVYTPAFFVNGRSWRPGWYNKALPEVNAMQNAKLQLSVNNEQISANFIPDKKINAPMHLHIAVLGMGLSTQIRGGENAGREALHEFVVLSHVNAVSDSANWQLTLPAFNTQGAQQLALVAWVSFVDSPVPLQVTGGLYP